MNRLIQVFFLFFIISLNQVFAQDSWQYVEHTNFEKYKDSNVQVKINPDYTDRVIFMGNSITEAWPILRPQFFENSNFIGRGISGQTTPHMLLRFRKDVINLKPKVVVFLAGINDIAQNTGFTPVDLIAENIMTMAELAKYHNIEVVICSVLPAIDFPWSPGLEPVNKVIELNSILKKYAEKNNLVYVDYHSALKDEDNGLKVPNYTAENDLIHPNVEGYKVMESLIEPVIKKALAIKKL